MPNESTSAGQKKPVRRRSVLKEYYVSFVSTLAVLYALLVAALAFGQAIGADRTLNRFDKYVMMPQWTGSNVFPVIFTIFMLYLAYHLWFKKRAALIVLCSYIFLRAVFYLNGGINTTWTAINLVLALFFLTSWAAFKVVPDSRFIRRALMLSAIAIPVLAIYGTVGLYLGRRAYKIPTSGPSLLKNTWLLATGRSSIHFVGRDLLFKYTLIIAVIAAIAYVLFLLFRPHRPPEEYSWEEEETARKILDQYGSDSLSYFNTRKGKSYFFLGDECFLAFRVVGGMAIISGEPVGPYELFAPLLEGFREHCLHMGWRLSGMGLSERAAVVLKQMRLHVFQLGEEAWVDVRHFTLEGRGVRKLRQAVNQVEKRGVRIELMYNAGIPNHVRHELQEISRTWRGDNPETGFSMGLGRLLSASDPDCLLSLAYDSESKPIGFLYWVPMYPHAGFSLDITRTMYGAPKALSDCIIARTAQFLASEDYQYLSLHFLAMSQWYRPGSDRKPSRFWATFARTIDRWFPVVSSYNYDNKFSPIFVKRYIIYPSYLEFLRAGLTVVAAESALKLTRPAERKVREQEALAEESDAG
jgi:lysyl-tRNA synthetase, class II